MALYVGELVRLTVTAKSFASESVSPDDIDSMNVSVYNAAGEVVIAEREMTWQPDEELWYWLWMTTTDETPTGELIDPGTYRAKVRMIDLDDHPSVEYLRVRLSRNPV